MELEGVTNVQPADDHYEYFFTVSRVGLGVREVKKKPRFFNRDTIHQVMCSSCRQVHPKTVGLNQKVTFFFPSLSHKLKDLLEQQDEYEISGSKGKASFVWRCSNCKV